MQRLLEILFGATRDGAAPGVDRAIDFNPPVWRASHARLLNTLLIIAALVVVFLIYRREGRRKGPKIGLGILRVLLFVYVIILLNRPVIRETRTHVEPSVLAILIDNTISMSIPDVTRDGAPSTQPGVAIATPGTQPSTQPTSADPNSPSRLQAVMNLLSGEDQALLKKLAKVHTVHLYTFNKDAREIATTTPQTPTNQPAAPSDGGAGGADKAKDNGGVTPQVVGAIQGVDGDMEAGRTTQVVSSLLPVLDNLQGQRLAGVVVITDARETPTQSPPGLIERLRRYPTKIYPVAVGSDKSPQNIDLVAVNMQDSVFKDDIVSAKVTVRATGYEPNHAIKIMLRDKKTGATLQGPEGKPAEKTITVVDANPVDEELLIMPDQVGLLDIEAVAEPQPGELNLEDNVRPATVAVLDAKINVLYADGYPRWEYRYIKNEMIRDKTINISCLLTSADERFAQEGDSP